jgi:transposase
MYVRRVRLRNGPKEYTYIKVVESVRENGRPVQKTVLNLGNVDQWPDDRVAKLCCLLKEFVGIGSAESPRLRLEDVKMEDPRVLGPYLPLAHIWDELNLDATLDGLLKNTKLGAAARDCIKVMVLTRLVKPLSKRAVCEMAVNKVQIPGIDASKLPEHMYYRALSFLSTVRTEIEKTLHNRMTHLFNRDVSLVFYDLTSSYFEGDHCKMARRGYSREHRPDLVQIEVGLMVDAEGLPIGHEVFEGNVNDVSTVLGTLDRLKDTFGVCRCVFVGDDGMASKANMDAIGEKGFEYITSLSLGNSKIGKELLATHPPARKWEEIDKKSLFLRVMHKEEGGRTYIGSYNPQRSRATRSSRKGLLRACLDGLARFNVSVKEPEKPRAKKHTPEERMGAAEKFLIQKRARDLFNITINDEGQLKWTLNRRALRPLRAKDGVTILVTNSQTLTPYEVAHGYRTLWRVENAFRHMKGDIGLRPIRHWNDSRVLGHVCVCVLAYLIECLYDRALDKAGLDTSARTALSDLSKIITATLVCGDEKLRRRSEITPQQRRLLTAAGVNHVSEIW